MTGFDRVSGEPRPLPAVREHPNDVLLALRRVAASAVGCPAAAPSAFALGLGWRLRADALFLAASHAAAAGDAGVRAGAPRLRRLAQVWAAGAARLVRDGEPTARRLAWLDGFFRRSALLPGDGRAWAVMAGELAVYRLHRLVLPPDTCARERADGSPQEPRFGLASPTVVQSPADPSAVNGCAP